MLMKLRNPLLLALLVLFSLLVMIPSVNVSRIQASLPEYWPTDDWLTSTPDAHGMNVTRLEEMEAYIDLCTWNEDLYSLLIVHNGYLVYENYFGYSARENELNHIRSCTTSVTSILVGIAITQGYIGSVHDYVLDYFPDRAFTNMDAWKEAITIEHLLTMTSGLLWEEARIPVDNPQSDYYIMTHSSNWVQWILDRPMEHAPGEFWEYNTGASHLLSAIISEATGMNTSVFADEFLFTPLGITSFQWLEDPQGIAAGGSDLYLRPRDMAKIGFLYLQEGIWDGQIIVPHSWVVASTTTFHTIFPIAQSHGYGYEWWTHPRIHAFAAHDFLGQRIWVLPVYDLVVILTGYSHSIRHHNIVEDYIMQSMPVSPPFFDPLVINFAIAIGIVIALVIIGVYWKRRMR